MAAARILLVIVCITLANRSIVFGSNFITDKKYNYERQRNSTKLINIARKEIGVREIGHNAGPRVHQYLAYVGFTTAAPWCAAFVSYIFWQAGYNQPKIAWSPSLFPAARLARDALPGMVMGIYFDNLKRIAHVGIVEKIQGSFLFSIEGNTNLAGSRNGDGVYRKTRHIRTIYRYADWL